MDAKVKRLWLKALRSKKYRQARGVLLRKGGAMCCIGVLGHIQGVPRPKMLEKCSATLPPGKNAGLRKDSRNKLAEMNDSRKSFLQIADYIEKHH